MRRCTICGEEKPLTEFYPRRKKDGWQGWRSECKTCNNVTRKERKARSEDPTLKKHRWGAPGYVMVHMQISAQRGKAAEHTCACGEPAAEWALDHAEITEHWRVDNSTVKHGKVFSLEPNDYVPKCRVCHFGDGSPNWAGIGDKLYRMGRVSRPELLEKTA